MKMITEKAYAKINLTLDVLSKRADGYHNVAMVMQSISLADEITVYEADAGVSLVCTEPNLPTDSRNLAYKAAEAILAGSGKGVAITLEKKIPLEAGLAGGSSDAAAVLRGINKLYSLNKSHQELLQLAVALGADVPFCLDGGTALAEGIGEILTPLPHVPLLWLVLIKPNFGISTALVYRSLKIAEIASHPDTSLMLTAIKAKNSKDIVANIANVLEDVTLKLKPELKQYKNLLQNLGAENVLMSGSGPTIFGIFLSQESAEQAAAKVNIPSAAVFVAQTLSVKEE